MPAVGAADPVGQRGVGEVDHVGAGVEVDGGPVGHARPDGWDRPRRAPAAERPLLACRPIKARVRLTSAPARR